MDAKKNRIATFQFTSPKAGPVIVRIQQGIRPENIVRLLEDESVIKIVHFAFGDGQFMMHHWGAQLKNLVCTKVAVRILTGKPEVNDSLKDLIPQYLGIEIDKGEQRSNWFADTLSQSQLRYAVQDVEHLYSLWSVLKTELFKENKMDLAILAFRALPLAIEFELEGLQFGQLYPYKVQTHGSREDHQNGNVKEKQLFTPIPT